MAENRVSFPIDNSSVIAVRLRALDGDLTNLNPNLSIGDVFIAEVAAESGIAIFIAGATAPDTTEPNLRDIPAGGIPSGDYEVMTANTKEGTLWEWDEQSEVSNITILNQDIKSIIDLRVEKAYVYNGLDKADSGYVLDARQGKVLDETKADVNHNHDAVYSKIADIVNDLVSTDIDKPLSAAQGKALKDLDDLKVAIADIVNNLTSTDTDKPLSAAQGKVLKDLDDLKVAIADIVNNLTSTDTDKPLSAAQGKVLKDDLDTHNHDTVYSAIDHDHDEDYAAIAHNHDATYSKIADIVNDLVSTDIDKPLSAAQGKALKDLLDSITQNIEDWTPQAESQVRDLYIDIYMALLYNSTIYYEAGGYFLIEYFFKNDAGYPSGMTPGSTWDTDALESAGYTVKSISSSQSLVSIPKPDPDDALYSGGEAGKATLVYHIKYKNALYETDFGENELVSSFSPPYGITEILDGLENNETLADLLATRLAHSATLVQAVRQEVTT